MEPSKENKRQLLAEEIHVPTEIEKQILEHLPLKSLVRFRCTSKLWLLSINEIIHQRSDSKVSEILRSIASLHAKMNGLRVSLHLHFLLMRLKRTMDRILNLVYFGGGDGDVERIIYVDRLLPNVYQLHGVIDRLAKDA